MSIDASKVQWDAAPAIDATKVQWDEVPAQRRPAGSIAQVGRAAASLADITLGGVAPAIVQQLAYPVARMGQTAPEATATVRRLTQPLEQPFGRAFGVTETPEYQQDLVHLMTMQADSELAGGYGYVPWITKAPGVEEKHVVAQQGAQFRDDLVLEHARKALGRIAPA